MHKMKDILCIRDRLICEVKCAVEKGLEEVDTRELGAVVDMIKDLYETEKYCWESEYYETVIEAMEHGGGEYDKRGYYMKKYSSGWSEHMMADHEEPHEEHKPSFEHAASMMRELWHTADPTMRKKMKTDLALLMGEMKE